MSDFRARVTPALSPDAQVLVTAYESAVGSTGPGANPPSIAAVLMSLIANHTTSPSSAPEPYVRVAAILRLAHQLTPAPTTPED